MMFEASNDFRPRPGREMHKLYNNDRRGEDLSARIINDVRAVLRKSLSTSADEKRSIVHTMDFLPPRAGREAALREKRSQLAFPHRKRELCDSGKRCADLWARADSIIKDLIKEDEALN